MGSVYHMGYIHCFVVLILNVGIGSANEHNLDLIKELFLYEECVHIKEVLLVIK